MVLLKERVIIRDSLSSLLLLKIFIKQSAVILTLQKKDWTRRQLLMNVILIHLLVLYFSVFIRDHYLIAPSNHKLTPNPVDLSEHIGQQPFLILVLFFTCIGMSL